MESVGGGGRGRGRTRKKAKYERKSWRKEGEQRAEIKRHEEREIESRSNFLSIYSAVDFSVFRSFRRVNAKIWKSVADPAERREGHPRQTI